MTRRWESWRDWGAGWSSGLLPLQRSSLSPRAKFKPSERSPGFLTFASVAKRNQDKWPGAPQRLALRAPGHARSSRWHFWFWLGSERSTAPVQPPPWGGRWGSHGECVPGALGETAAPRGMCAVKLFETKLGNVGIGFLFPSHRLTFLKYIFFWFLKQKYSEGVSYVVFLQKTTCLPLKILVLKFSVENTNGF